MDKPISYVGPTGRERPGEHWNARIIREQHEAEQAEAMPDQPDGIADDSYDLPHAADAAERVRAYIEATGDGLYHVVDGHPLYARDLESIRRAALGLRQGQSTPYRLSPAGVLAWRDLRRSPGWMDPHWSVLHVPAGDITHHVGQRLTDQAVAGWSPLVRKGPSNVG